MGLPLKRKCLGIPKLQSVTFFGRVSLDEIEAHQQFFSVFNRIVLFVFGLFSVVHKEQRKIALKIYL